MNEKYDEKQGEPVLAAEGLIRNYTKTGEQKGKDEIKVLKGLNFQVDRQEFVGIMGRSGCGKTTLLKILGMIDRQTDGKLYFKGGDTEELWKDELADIRRRDIGFVFQDFYLMDSLTVRENNFAVLGHNAQTVSVAVIGNTDFGIAFTEHLL